MPLENVVRSYGDIIDRHGNKIYLSEYFVCAL